MDLSRKIIIFIICLIFIYILIRLIYKRFELHGLAIGLADLNAVESFETNVVKRLSSANKTPNRIQSFNPKALSSANGIKSVDDALQLKQYCIKSAYHAAFDGEEMTLDMVDYVLSRGCRFLHFDVYWASPTTTTSVNNPDFSNSSCPVVGMSSDPSTPAMNGVALLDVLNFINQNAFTNMCPNPADPLFIQICVKYVPKTFKGSTLYNAIASNVKKALTNLYYKEVTSNTHIDDLMGSIVLIMDTRNQNRFYATDSPTLKNIVSMEMPSNSMQVYTYTQMKGAPNNGLQIVSGNNGYITSATELNVVLPVLTESTDTDEYMMTSNYNAIDQVINQGMQITPMLFWENEFFLSQYEEMFNSASGGIIPMSRAMRFAQSNTSSNVKGMMYP